MKMVMMVMVMVLKMTAMGLVKVGEEGVSCHARWFLDFTSRSARL